MTDGSNTTVSTTVSRRSTRYFAEDQCTVESGNLESRHSSTSGDERDREKPQREAKTSSTNIDMGRIPMVNLGKDLGGLFPKTSEDLGKQGMHSLKIAPSWQSNTTQQSQKAFKLPWNLPRPRLMADLSTSAPSFQVRYIGAVFLWLKISNSSVLSA